MQREFYNALLHDLRAWQCDVDYRIFLAPLTPKSPKQERLDNGDCRCNFYRPDALHATQRTEGKH